MKKIVIAFLIFAASMFAISCQKGTTLVQNVSGPMTISAVAEGMNTPTKTEMLFKYDVAWSENDKIYVVDGSGNHDTFKLKTGAGTTKGTFTQEGTTQFNGVVQAYYPATMLESGSPVWPESQTNDQTIPMYCKKTLSGTTDERMDFASLGSVIQIVFNTTQENITLKSIEIQDGEKTMSGAFIVENGKAVITATDKAGITLDLGESGVVLGKGANFFNIAIPAGNYQALTLTFTAMDETKCVFNNGKINVIHNTVGKLVLTGNNFKHYIVPDGALPGIFSVSATRKVFFSQGNIYWDGSKFQFETNQYDYMSSWSTSHVSHFHWSKTASVAYAQDYSEKDPTDSDVFFTNAGGFTVNVGGKEQPGWSTLSKDEWTHLFKNRTMTNGKPRYTLNINYGGKSGLVLYPDDYVGDAISGNVDNLPEGVVFLPSAGYRYNSTFYQSYVKGNYWFSSACKNNKAYHLNFDSSNVSLDSNNDRDYGYCVRLVKEVE